MLGLKLDKDATDFLDVVIFANHVLIAENVTKVQLVGFALGLGASVERPIFSPQLLGGVAGHPKRFLVDHSARPGRISTIVSVFVSVRSIPKRETRFPAAFIEQFGGRTRGR